MTCRSRTLAAACLSLTLLAAGTTARAAEPVKVRLTLDWKFEGPAALFLLASRAGYFAAEGLDVTIDPGNGSAGAVNRVASGAYDLGVADLNALIDYDVKNPGQAMKGVYMVYNHAPYAIIALKKSGIAKPADLAGRKLGAPGFDAARKTWPAFAQHAKVPKDGVSWISMDAPLREPMLVKGQVDAISGFAFTSLLNLGHAGVPASELVVFNYSDFGVKLYGNAVIVSPRFAAAHPEQVKAFLRALNRSIKAVVADPAAGIKAVKAADPSLDEELEQKRLGIALKQSVLTPDVRADGLGAVREARLKAAIDEVVSSFGLAATPKTSDIFDAAFLPAKPERLAGH
ncbi:ABC transporter substrate-binding protein [Anaeromyxobacter diazotrophicus]|uniref:Thiamine pyrimidine synthase n=1 Tax=Anaeromyxobacter diazotrophicus TaxID=2590199 RepID=A0A7I9VQT9_9BACT|nr:ABC transporter substrate-binding protein [Anaeromyxobacter diazotrophicus]GEJ58782.1 ABC transporter substrate-binding protein [Anaeromyxobacter diazotrophicus]